MSYQKFLGDRIIHIKTEANQSWCMSITLTTWLISPSTRTTSSTTDRSPHRPDLLPRKGHDFVFKLNVDAIFEATQQQISYTLNRDTPKGLDEYNDSILYGIGYRHEEALLKLEVDNLVRAATSNYAALFDSEGQLSLNVKDAFEDKAKPSQSNEVYDGHYWAR